MKNSINNLAILLLGFMSIFAIYKQFDGNNNSLQENFVGINMKSRTERIACDSQGNCESLPGGNQATLSECQYNTRENYGSQGPDYFYEVPGQKDKNLIDRFSPNGLGSAVNYNLPDVEHLGTTPEQYANIVEGYCGESNNFDSSKTPEYVDANEVKPMPSAMESDQDIKVIYDRQIYAPTKSKSCSQGDWIRGDLPIVNINPTIGDANSLIWGRPAANPVTDLNSGAMAVLGGAYNDTCRDLASLQQRSSDGLWNIAGGSPWKRLENTPYGAMENNPVNNALPSPEAKCMNVNQSVQKQMGTDMGGADVFTDVQPTRYY